MNSGYLVGMIRSEAIRYVSALDISPQEREELMREAKRLRAERQQEQMYKWASERDDLHREYVARIVSAIRENGGQASVTQLKEATGMNGNRLYGVLRRAILEGSITREIVARGKYIYGVSC